MRRLLLFACLILLLAAGPARAANGVDHVASDGVELVQNVRTVGAGQGISVVGNRMFVTSPTHLSVFDISDPEAPALLGGVNSEGANETEDVVTNGRILVVASVACECIRIYDVTGNAPQLLSTVELSGQIASCVDDCRRLWVTGPNAIVDLADPAAPKVVGTFLDDDAAADANVSTCFQAREVRPGLVLVACDPVLLFSTLPEHGGTPTKPKLIATAPTPNVDYFLAGAPHSSHWPRGGADAFMIASTETPFHAECSEDIGAVVTWDTEPVQALAPGSRFRLVDQWRPQNGGYTDGRSPYNAVGCSPHFLDEHPAFHDGGLVAAAALENGVRLLQVTADGALEERGWFLGAGGTAAVPVWHPNGRVLYVADYARGLDVLRYTGDTFVPPHQEPPAVGQAPVPGTRTTGRPAPRFRIAGVRRRSRGRSTLIVQVPSAGRLTVRGRGIRTIRMRAGEGGLVAIGIRSRRKAVRVAVTFRPRGGQAQTRRARVPLRR